MRILHIIAALFLSAMLGGMHAAWAGEKEAPTILRPADSPVLFGVIATDMPADMRAEMGGNIDRNEGLCVTAVSRFSPAEDAGIRPVDIILKVDGQSVATKLDLLLILQQHKPGDAIPVHILRLNQPRELNLKLGHRHADLPPSPASASAPACPALASAPSNGVDFRQDERKPFNGAPLEKHTFAAEYLEEALGPDKQTNLELARRKTTWARAEQASTEQTDTLASKGKKSTQTPSHPSTSMNQKQELAGGQMEQIQNLQRDVIAQLSDDRMDKELVKSSLIQIRNLASGQNARGRASILLEDSMGRIIIQGTEQHVTVEEGADKNQTGTTYRIDIPSKDNPLPQPLRTRLRKLNQ